MREEETKGKRKVERRRKEREANEKGYRIE